MDTAFELLNERDAARRLGLSVATMRRRRLFHQPPTWVKLGARVLYSVGSLDSFVLANTVLINPAEAGGQGSGCTVSGTGKRRSNRG